MACFRLLHDDDDDDDDDEYRCRVLVTAQLVAGKYCVVFTCQ